jgi:TRAP-type C4-dicarboxylate transport system permease small subunit
MKRMHESLLAASKFLATVFVIALIVVIAANIVMREAFAVALVWATEVSLALFVWVAFLGAAIAFAENARIRFTFITDLLPPGGRSAIEVLITWIGFVLLAGFFVTSIYVAWVHRHETFTTMNTSVMWQWAAVPVSLVLGISGWILNGSWTLAQAGNKNELKLVGT